MTDATDPLAGIPDQPPAAPADAGSVLAEVWTNIFPWSDLNAKGPPERNLKLGTEILPTLAVQAIQTPAGPRLVQGDSLGHQVTAISQNLTDVLAADAAGGTSVLKVGQSDLFPPGTWVILTPAPGTGSVLPTGPYQVGSFVPGILQLESTLAQDYHAGDYVVAVGQYVPIGFQPIDRPVDDARFVVGLNGAVASIIFPAQTFQAWVLAYLHAEMIQTGATGGGAQVQVWNGLSGLGVQKWAQDLVLPAGANQIDRFAHDRLPIRTDPGSPLEIITTVPPGTCNVRLSAGAYLDMQSTQGL